MTKSDFSQPSVFKLAFITAMFERFGYYVLSFMLVLYLKAEFNLPDTQAFILFGVVTALAFMLPILGGYLGDNVFGIKRCMLWGLIIEGLGLVLLAVPNHIVLPFALALVVVGVGLYKTSPTDLLGRAYQKNDPRMDSGFTLFYMTMSIGSFASSIISGLAQRYLGWHMAFLIGGIGLFVGVIFYLLFKHTAKSLDSKVGQKKLSIRRWADFFVSIILAVTVCWFIIAHLRFLDELLVAVVVLVGLYYFYEIVKSPKEDKLKIGACLILILIGMAYFILYMQIFTSIDLFIDRNVIRNIFGFNVPTEAFFALNPIWIIILGPILAKIYKIFADKFGKDLPVTSKFFIGLFAVSLSFFVLVLSISFANINSQISSLWMIAVFGLFTLGEMLVSALGLAMVAHIVPKRIYGVTMGTWFVGVGLAASLSGFFAGLANIPATIKEPHLMLAIYNSAFMKIGMGGLICTFIVFLVSPYIKKMANLR